MLETIWVSIGWFVCGVAALSMLWLFHWRLWVLPRSHRFALAVVTMGLALKSTGSLIDCRAPIAGDALIEIAVCSLAIAYGFVGLQSDGNCRISIEDSRDGSK